MMIAWLGLVVAGRDFKILVGKLSIVILFSKPELTQIGCHGQEWMRKFYCLAVAVLLACVCAFWTLHFVLARVEGRNVT